MINRKNIFITLGLAFFITGCSNVKTLEITPQNNIINKESPLQIRDVQIRTFENTSKDALVNAIVDTLLDDGYFITLIDSKAGVISAKNSKNNLELDLVSVIKEVKDNTFLIRFSINAIDKSLAFKSYMVIEDDVIYRYLFDRLRKSLFLDKEFYDTKNNHKPKREDKTIVIHHPIIKKDEIKVKKETPKKVTKKCVSSKCENSSSLIYSVQLLCTLDKELALKEYGILKAKNLDVRTHSFYQYQVVRLGRFKNRLEAENSMKDLKSTYPEISIVAFKPKR